jgi:serine/threonine-protein kinase
MSDPVARLNAALSGRYRIECQLGEGGMATVYLASDLKHDRKVALKVLKPELAAVVGAERFLAEIRTTANLQHPHVLPLHDSGEADGLLFYVMPYIEGETLRDRLDREHQLPVDEAVRISTNVAEALDYAHRHGVIHRDIKPANILLVDGKPVVADFGIALAVSSGSAGRMTETGLSLGTPHYMSPEQATGDAHVGPATDIWALGCVLYEMLVGEPPHIGSTAQAVLGKIITEKPRSPRQVRATLPLNVDAAVMRALERLPADRFATAGDFVRALSDPRFRHGQTAPGAAPTRRAMLVTAGLGTATVVLLGTTLWGWLRPAAPGPVVRFELTLPQGIVPNSANGVGLELSPDGSRVVFAGSLAGGSVQLWQRSLNQLEPSPIPGTANGRNPRFSPDGTSLAFTADGRLSTVSLTGAPPLTLVTEGVPDGGGGLAWSEDGWLYFRKQDVGIWKVPANGGEAEQVTAPTPPEAGHLWPDALPEGRGILFTRRLGGPTEDEIAVLDLETGETSTLFQGAMARYARSGHVVYASGDGLLLAAPFDTERLVVTGPALTLVEGVQVNTGSASYFAMSENGVLIYRPGMAGSEGQPVWIGRDGIEEILDPALVGRFNHPAVSPDGTQVALARVEVVGRSDIWVYDTDQRLPTRLTFDGNSVMPFWSPDGREVGFSSGPVGARALYARPADLSAEARLLYADAAATLISGQWTPDGARLVFERDVGTRFDVYHVAAHPDSAAVAFVATDFDEEAPALSPDGRWLAYVSDESGQDEVYVRPFPGPGGRFAVSQGGGDSPAWASDREIVYEAAGGSYVAATLRAGPTFAIERRDAIARWEVFLGGSGSTQYDISRRDGRLLAIRLGETVLVEGPVRDVVILNWFEELEERVGH